MATQPLQAESTLAKTGDPFEMFNAFGCAQERIEAALHLLSDSLADFNEEQSRKLTEGQLVRLNRDWLLLEMIRHDQKRNAALFSEAEQMLYAAGVQRDWNARHASTPDRTAWNAAKRHFVEAEAACEDYYRTVWKPASDRLAAFEKQNGLTSPGSDHPATPDFFEKRKVLLEAHPELAIPDEIDEEIERLADEASAARSALMDMEAPDLQALRWKLDVALGVVDGDLDQNGSTPCLSADYVRQTIADYNRLQGAA